MREIINIFLNIFKRPYDIIILEGIGISIRKRC